jgi:hypothetical protein
MQKEVDMCDAISKHGATLIKHGENILTHCNTGALATPGKGTPSPYNFNYSSLSLSLSLLSLSLFFSVSPLIIILIIAFYIISNLLLIKHCQGFPPSFLSYSPFLF